MSNNGGFRTLAAAANNTGNLARKLRCPGSGAGMVRCMKALPADVIALADAGRGHAPFLTPEWGPVLDGVELTRSPIAMLVHGLEFTPRHTSVAAGSNTNEGSIFIRPKYPTGMTAGAYDAFITGLFANGGRAPNSTERAMIYSLYPPAADNVANAAAVVGDAFFVCGTRFFLKYMAKAVKHGSYGYHFAHLRPFECTGVPVSWGIVHEAELDYVFKTPLGGSVCPAFTPYGAEVGLKMRGEWAAYAGGGVPSSAWPRYDPGSDGYALFGGPGEPAQATETHRRKRECDFWEGFILARQ